MKPRLIDRAKMPRVIDGLEQLILDEIAKQARLDTTLLALDLPCGDGRRAAEMARMGAMVLASDVPARASTVMGRALAAEVSKQVSFRPCRLESDPLPFDAGTQFDLIFCHCGFCFLPYAEARKLLARLLKSLRIGGKLFVSAHGLYSDLGEGYKDYNHPIDMRFCALAPDAAKRYDIKGKICLYSERDLLRALIEIGSGVLRTFTSTHGAVKGVAVRI